MSHQKWCTCGGFGQPGTLCTPSASSTDTVVDGAEHGPAAGEKNGVMCRKPVYAISGIEKFDRFRIFKLYFMFRSYVSPMCTKPKQAAL